VKAWTATGVLVALIVLLALGLFPALLVASSTLATPLAPRRSHRSGRARRRRAHRHDADAACCEPESLGICGLQIYPGSP
jgi:hypothetical protein